MSDKFCGIKSNPETAYKKGYENGLEVLGDNRLIFLNDSYYGCDCETCHEQFRKGFNLSICETNVIDGVVVK